MKYAEKYGVSRASRKYNKSRSYIYFWKARWDGSVASLACQSRRPHSHPNQHTEAELKLIRDMRRRNPDLGMVELWHRLRKRGYTRRPESLFRVLRKLGLFSAPEKKKAYKPKPYEQMTHPGQRVQVDVKVVPAGALRTRSSACSSTPPLMSLHAFASWPPTLSSPPIPPRISYKGCSSGTPAGGSVLNVSRPITDLSSPIVFPTVSESCPRYLKQRLPNWTSATNSSVPIRPATTEKWSAATGRTRNAFTPATTFIPWMTSQSSSPSTTAAPTTSL